jgi:hypothetical protein
MEAIMIAGNEPAAIRPEVGLLAPSLGGIGAGFDHLGAAAGAKRGLVAGSIFGGAILVAHQIHGAEAKPTSLTSDPADRDHHRPRGGIRGAGRLAPCAGDTTGRVKRGAKRPKRLAQTGILSAACWSRSW